MNNETNNPSKTLFSTGPDIGWHRQTRVQEFCAQNDWVKCCAFVHESSDQENSYEHYHAVWRFRKTVRPVYFAGLLRDAGIGGHVQNLKGTPFDAVKYINKQNPCTIIGQEPSDFRGGASDKNIFKKLKRSIDECFEQDKTVKEIHEMIDDEYFGHIIRYEKGINRYITRKIKKVRKESMTIIWHYGDTGTGKSHSCPIEAYWKPPGTKWFDGYNYERIVVLDEFRPDWWPFAYMLRLTDVNPFSVENKGSHLFWAVREIHVTCPYHPQSCWQTEENIEQLLRRITTVIKHTKEGDEYKQEIVPTFVGNQNFADMLFNMN